MNERERYLETLLFGKPDRIPFLPGGPRESTIAAWREQGLPDDVNWHGYVIGKLGLESTPHKDAPPFWLNHRMIPEFEEKVIEELEDSLVVQDWKGNICQISNRYDVTYLRVAKDFVTRKWIRCPVENRDDWEQMKTRYDPDDPSRVPPNLEELGKQVADRDYLMGVGVHGPFWQLREWLGFEGLCMLFKDDPEFVREMIGFWTDYTSKLLMKVLPHVQIDSVHVSEDMAFKEKSMISPDMAREFLLPCYRQWSETIRSCGCPIYDMDSDGFIGELIPVWIEAGFNVCDPIEVAAGNDINEFRESFGHKIAFKGGVDKRAMAKGGQVIRDELARIKPVIRDGGYIPSCDHGVPADVGWAEFLDYCELLARMTGWK